MLLYLWLLKRGREGKLGPLVEVGVGEVCGVDCQNERFEMQAARGGSAESGEAIAVLDIVGVAVEVPELRERGEQARKVIDIAEIEAFEFGEPVSGPLAEAERPAALKELSLDHFLGG